jgi:ribA/ribD-fused uncharacterized protein
MRFVGEYAWLSNFYASPLRVGKYNAQTVEHAYQLWKCANTGDRGWVCAAPTPAEAKRRGRRVMQRADWNDIRVQAMRYCLTLKFAPGTELAAKLVALGGEIVEDNYWHDRFWGRCVCAKCGGQGENMLGTLLMERRAELIRLASSR